MMAGMRCPICQHDNPEGARFCLTCGSTLASERLPCVTLESRFQEWQREVSPSVRQSTIVPYSGENRTVTVLLAAPAAVLDAGTVDGVLRTIIDALGCYEGRIDRFLDNRLLAVFGTPTAHEDDPQRAILAAMQIRQQAQALGCKLRAGIATGPFSCESVGADEHHEITVTSPAVNLAAQLQEKARAGDIVIGESTRRHAWRAFELTPLPLEVTGVATPVTAYRVERRLSRLEKVRGIEGLRTELIGRDEELATLRAAYAEVMGGSGRMVSVIGEAGVGKSRLVAELRRYAEQRPSGSTPSLWLEGRCLEVGVRSAYGPFIDLLEQHFGLARQGRESTRARRIMDALAELRRGGALSAERAQEIGPLMGKLLSVRFGTEWDDRLAHAQPAQIKHQTFLAIRDMLIALAGGRPLVVMLDDLERADGLSIDMISLLMESIALAPILLLCAYRPEQDRQSWRLSAAASRTCPERYTEIVLKELSPSQSRRLIQSLLAVDLVPSAVLESVLAASQGNPFFMEEMIRAMIDSGVIYRDGDRWSAREDAGTALVPETLQGVILGRVDRLAEEPKHVLQGASVIGRVFRRRVLEGALEGRTALGESLAELEKRALIIPGDAALDPEYSFKHVLTQQAVYQSIPSRRRCALHRRVAEAIEAQQAGSPDEYCEQLAFHHERAGDTPKAIEYLVLAGEKARGAYLNEGAVGYFRRALELMGVSCEPQSGRRTQILCKLGELYEVTGRHDQAEAMFREAAELGRVIGLPPRELARIHYLLCKTLTARHRPLEYVPIAQESLALLAADRDCVEAVFAEFVVAYGSFDRGDFSALCEYAARRGSFIRSMPYSQEMALNASYLAWAHVVNKDETQAAGWLDWLEREARQHNDLLSLAAIHVRRGRDVLAQRGELSGALAAIEQAIELYRTIGARYLEAQCHLYEGDVCYRFGRLEQAEECFRRSSAISGELEQRAHLLAESGLLRGQIALSRGDPQFALASFQAALRAAPGEQWEWLLQFLIGCTLLQQERKREASRLFMNLVGSTLTFRLPPAYSLTIDLPYVLSLLERCEDGGPDFRAACDLVRRKRPQARSLLAQWYLEPAQATSFPRVVQQHDLCSALSPEWVWHDMYHDCEHRTDQGLMVQAAVGRGLWGVNLGAPRLLRPASGDLALQAACGCGASARPAVGGLLIWKDERNYLRLDRGSMGEKNILFSGCIGNAHVVVGRGSLGVDRAALRLERHGPTVRALCGSHDGVSWYTVGETSFPVGDPLQIGFFADGAIRPEIYPRSYGDGSEIRFTDFLLLSR